MPNTQLKREKNFYIIKRNYWLMEIEQKLKFKQTYKQTTLVSHKNSPFSVEEFEKRCGKVFLQLTFLVLLISFPTAKRSGKQTG